MSSLPSPPRLDVLAMGDAMVDVIAPADDAFLVREGLPKGSMRLIDAAEAARLYALMGPAKATSGGSAANTAAGLAALGRRVGFVGQVADDQLGAIFAHDLRAQGVEYGTPRCADGTPTGRCLILVTPDAQRTMNTHAGASHRLTVADLDEGQIRDAAILYLEAYLWAAPGPRAAMQRAAGIARDAGRRVAFTLSDVACIRRDRDALVELIDAGLVDLLFGNEAEICAIASEPDFDGAVSKLAARVPLLVATCGAQGALAVDRGERVTVPAVWVTSVVDTTGAGDLFAAGFLAGDAEGRPTAQCLRMGALAASEVIAHYGARPETDLRALFARELAA